MFSSLRARLWFTYALLVVTALSVVAVVLLLYVIRNPLPYRQTLERVRAAEKLISTHSTQLTGGANQTSLGTVAQAFDVRVVIFSPDGKSILVDTLPGKDVLSLPTGDIARRKLPVTRDTKGKLWIYSQSTLPDGTILLVAAPRPLVAGLALFADSLLPLFVEGGVVALLLSLVLAFVIARWVADPLQRMLTAARTVPSAEATPVEPRGPREVQDVMRAFNSMVARVQASQTSQREFVANVSHELKTPLTSIQGFAQAILDGTADTLEARRQAAEVINAESARMHRMVLDLLDLARLDSGTADMQMSPLDMGVLLNGIAEKFAPLAKQAGVTISVRAADLPMLAGDGDRLAQVFTNLVDNALKFTPAGGEVVLSARQEGLGVEIEVSDTGVGIAPEALPHVFDRFYQADASRSRQGRQGAGLGLAIAQEIVGAHGGKISVRSLSGQGAAFTVFLPLAQPTAITVVTRK
jgi:signal transduction histidine kinase